MSRSLKLDWRSSNSIPDYKAESVRRGCPPGTCEYCISNRTFQHQRELARASVPDSLEDLESIWLRDFTNFAYEEWMEYEETYTS